MDASVIIPARDAAATLGGCLRALAEQELRADFEIIVVDDASGDATATVARRAGVRVVSAGGGGPAAARNLGAAASRGALLAFTDADCEPAPGWLGAMLDAARSADLLQGKVLPAPGQAVGPFDRFIAVVSEYGLYETANLAVRRDLFDRLQGFQSILRPRSGKELGEDVWLGWRARRAGARVRFCAEALVHHAVFPRGRSAYVAERARLRFFPELVRRIPELRDEFCHHRLFLNRRTMLLDLALMAAAGSAVGHRPLLLAGALPYARELTVDATRWPRPVRVATAQLAADLVGAGALLYGSARSRTLLL